MCPRKSGATYQLLGASGVSVGGTLYNVEFLEATCIVLFNGCDSTADFDFTSDVSAAAASQALLDQVFIDGPSGLFDTDPTLTFGCSDALICGALTPYAVIDPRPIFRAAVAANSLAEAADNSIGIQESEAIYDSNISSFLVYARWSVVPEPGTGLLIGLGLIMMGVRTRRAS